jgi:hypothetical protein
MNSMQKKKSQEQQTEPAAKSVKPESQSRVVQRALTILLIGETVLDHQPAHLDK